MNADELVQDESPDAWRDERDGRIYVNHRKHPDSSFAFDGDGTPLWFTDGALRA